MTKIRIISWEENITTKSIGKLSIAIYDGDNHHDFIVLIPNLYVAINHYSKDIELREQVNKNKYASIKIFGDSVKKEIIKTLKQYGITYQKYFNAMVFKGEIGNGTKTKLINDRTYNARIKHKKNTTH